MHASAAMFAQRGLAIPFPHADVLFVSSSVYDWQLKDELAVSSYYIGDFQSSLQHCTDLLRGTILPEEHRGRIERNLQLAIQALSEESATNWKDHHGHKKD
jgi:hypothetical protein